MAVNPDHVHAPRPQTIGLGTVAQQWAVIQVFQLAAVPLWQQIEKKEKKTGGWRHFVFPDFLPLLFHCTFVKDDVQSLSARRANQQLVTFEMTIEVSVKSAASLCLSATRFYKKKKERKMLKIKPANLKAEACTQQNWLYEGLMASLRTFIRSRNETMYFKTEILWEILPERTATFRF